MNVFFIIGCISAFLAVSLGAFGAHGLEGHISAKMLEIWKTGVQYQMFHVIALFVVSFVSTKIEATTLLSWAGWLFILGTLLFSGSLYVLALTNISKLGIITPFGGITFLAGWVLLAIAAYRYM